MSIISVNNLTFAYDGSADYIFKDATFILDTDWRLGFVGRNGRGKTTFLRLLMRQMEYTGSINASVDFSYFPFEVSDKTALTYDIIEDLIPDFEQWRLIKELNLLNISADCLYMPFNLLSGGEQSKILLAALFVKENNFLLIDEPTNHLDAEARKSVAQYLATKKNFILVSHDRAFLDGAVDHIISINRADIEVVKGNFSSWLINKERQDNFEKAQNEKLKGEIDRLKTAAKRNGDWAQKGHKESTESPDSRQIGYKEFHRKKAGKLDSQAKQMEKRFDKMADEKSKLLKNIETSWQLKINPLKHHSQRLVEARDLSIAYGEKTVFSSLNLTIEQGDRIAIIGKNGCGKSSLIKLILNALDKNNATDFASRQTKNSGDLHAKTATNAKNDEVNSAAAPANCDENFSAKTTTIPINYGENFSAKTTTIPINYGENFSAKTTTIPTNYGENFSAKAVLNYSGQLWLAPSLKVSYVSQDTSSLCGLLKDFAMQNDLDETLFKTILSKLDFSSSQFDKDISAFSAGQKKKVLLAKSLSQSAHLYIWDEPLNFIDIYSRIQIENLIKEYVPTMLFVEHDSAFTAVTATKILQM